VVEEYGEALPFEDASFDLVYGRQVLHHARDLQLLCREVARVLKPSGRFVATREHVISKPEDLSTFLENHPLHRLYGGENAFLLDQYKEAITRCGLRLRHVLGHFDSAINYHPTTYDQWRACCCAPLIRRIGARATFLITSERHFVGRKVLGYLSSRVSNSLDVPGRLYSFVAERTV